MNKFSVGNVISNIYGDVLIITSIKKMEPAPDAIVKWEPYDYVNYKPYKGNYTGGFNVKGYYTREVCECWYNSAFRCYTASGPDEDCEKCKGSGEAQVYRYSLNDCKFLAENVRAYKIMKLEEKIEKTKKTLERLKNDVT